jgi:putative ABC transport system permease protein
MNPFELIRLSFEALMERKLRSGLTILMVVIGGALMTSVSGLGGGMNNFINEQLGTLGANVLMISPSQETMGPGSHGMDQAVKMKFTSQTVRTIERIYGVKYVVPYFSGTATLRSGSKANTVAIMGIDQDKLEYITPKISLESGAFVSVQDSVGIVLGHGVAYPSDLDRPFVKRGQTVSIEFTKIETVGGREKTVTDKKSFQVRGIIEELGSMQIDSQAFISPAAANAIFDKGRVYDGIYGITKSPEVNDEVEARIKQVYGKNIGVTSPKALMQTIEDVMGSVMSFISAIAVVSMFVGAVGIVTTLYTSVMERTREIGLLKALGCDNGTVLLMFLTESMGIGIMGGLLGLSLGAIGAYVLIQIMSFGPGGFSISPSFSPTELLEIFLLAFILSIAAGLYPAWRAAKLSPIAALRKE